MTPVGPDGWPLIDGLTLDEIEAHMGLCCVPMAAEIRRLRADLQRAEHGEGCGSAAGLDPKRCNCWLKEVRRA